jgi:hypothetical protein
MYKLELKQTEEEFEDGGGDYEVVLNGKVIGDVYTCEGDLVFCWYDTLEEKKLVSIDHNGFISSEVVQI